MEIATKLKELRISHNLTQAELGEALQMRQGTIANYETGLREPHINSLVSYANYFKCSIDYLIGREDDFGNITIKSEKPADLSDDELKIVKQYRSLHAGYKALIENQIKFLAEQQEALEVPAFEHIEKQTNKKR